ncbi:MAG: riboflavin kinase [Agathobacter rectalis]
MQAYYRGQNPIGAETYIIDFGQDVYGQDIMVELHKFVRPEMKFDSIEALKSQMSADINYTINYAGSHTF